MAVTVAELIAELKQYDPCAKLYYVLKDNNKVSISNVVSYAHDTDNMPGVAFYLQTNYVKNDKVLKENI